jgi:hypothetical protein
MTRCWLHPAGWPVPASPPLLVCSCSYTVPQHHRNASPVSFASRTSTQGDRPRPPIDRGGGGLGQSRHSSAPPSLPRSPTPFDIDAIKKIADGLVTLASPEKKGTARGMGQDFLAVVRKLHNAAQNQTGTISLANLRKVVAEELRAAATAPQDIRPESQWPPKNLATPRRRPPPQLRLC